MSHPKKILLSLNAAARRSLSQNFLTSPYWAENLVARVLEGAPPEEYWEIGPGLGALTQVLLQRSPVPVRVFEYDRKLAQHLRETYPTLTLIEGDVLDADFSAIAPGKKIAILSNLPYHLSSPILFKLLEQGDRFTRYVLTFQKEFAERLIASPRTPAYSGLSVIAQTYCKIESVGVIPPGAFYPAPGVSSEALRLEPRKAPFPLNILSPIVKAAFEHRRKKLIRNLESILPKEILPPLFAELRIDPLARPEELSKELYWEITKRSLPPIP